MDNSQQNEKWRSERRKEVRELRLGRRVRAMSSGADKAVRGRCVEIRRQLFRAGIFCALVNDVL